MNNRTMIVPDLDTGKEKALPVVKVFHWNCQSLTPRLKIHSVWYLGIVDFSSIQFSSVAQSCTILCDPVDCSTPGLPVRHQFSEFTQIYVHWVGDAVQPSHPLSSPSPPAPNPSQHQGLFKKSQLFASGGQSIGVSASTSVLPMNTQDWPPLGWT